jgi:insulysin
MTCAATTAYPDENEYSAYLAKHGGSSNAYTDVESTNYHFDVNEGHLEAALDIFSHFFIDPLFTHSGTERELNAVNSENSQNLQSDPWRELQVYKAVSSKDHPFHQVTCPLTNNVAVVVVVSAVVV